MTADSCGVGIVYFYAAPIHTYAYHNRSIMAKRRLNPKEVDQLLTQYRSERRRLMFQLETVREAIRDLKALHGGEPEEGDETPVKRGPGRPRKAETVDRKAAKPGRRKRREIKNGGYRLSEWDNVVINAITKTNELLPKEELLKHVIAWARKNEPAMKESEVEAKLTRVLQKLSGKRGVLGAHRSGLRRGYHYGLKEWFFTSSGKLRKQHLEKLVLADA